jgi:hypothetical protein
MGYLCGPYFREEKGVRKEEDCCEDDGSVFFTII